MPARFLPVSAPTARACSRRPPRIPACAARVRHALLLERLDGGAGGKGGIAVIRGAAAVELVAPAHGRPRAEALAPADHLRLLVEVAVEKHGVIAAARDFHVDDGRAARK